MTNTGIALLDANPSRTQIMSAEDAATIVDCATVHNSIVHERCVVSNRATVRHSVLLESSSATNNAKVMRRKRFGAVWSCVTGVIILLCNSQVEHSILGPDSGVGSGECGHCLLGPFVGFHHQSLLIAALWPLGRGNIAYGANVGSNHTGRSNDQEIIVGEGVFFGLGCAIKFPFDCSHSPYSLIASGVVCLPQKVAYPFSLIVEKTTTDLDATRPAFNEIKPGWVLYDSLYTVERNEQKFQSRRSARRCATDHSLFRPTIVDMLIDARRRLRSPTETGVQKPCYSEAEVREFCE